MGRKKRKFEEFTEFKRGFSRLTGKSRVEELEKLPEFSAVERQEGDLNKIVKEVNEINVNVNIDVEGVVNLIAQIGSDLTVEASEFDFEPAALPKQVFIEFPANDRQISLIRQLT